MKKGYVDELIICYDHHYPDEPVLNVCRINSRSSKEKYTVVRIFKGREAMSIYNNLYFGSPKFEEVHNAMVNEKSWDEFRSSGLLWFMNTILHMFGWAIVVDVEDGEVIRAYPSRVKFRGFSSEINDEGYIKVTEFLKDNIDDLTNEVYEDGEQE